MCNQVCASVLEAGGWQLATLLVSFVNTLMGEKMALKKAQLKRLAKQAADRVKAREAAAEQERLEAIHASIDPFLERLPEALAKDGEARFGLPDHCRRIEDAPDYAKYLAELCTGLGLAVEVKRECDVVGYSERCSSDLIIRDPSAPAKKKDAGE
ncbi:MAG: hypothetical protein K2Z81_25545 [Cyanobacteria bacterium]|nr:hypothetical protein [Cyanobacteriota bacterium]